MKRSTLYESNSFLATTRLITKFGLPGEPDARRTVQSATLRFFLADIIGTPPGPVSLWHSITDNDSEQLPSGCEDNSYTESLLDLVHATDVGQQYYELDVTDLVLADYAGDGNNPMSAFRPQVNEAVFFEDDQSHRYRFTMPGAGSGSVPYPTSMGKVRSLKEHDHDDPLET